jgi:hypothetical protein
MDIEDPRAPSSSLALVREAQTIEAEGRRLRAERAHLSDEEVRGHLLAMHEDFARDCPALFEMSSSPSGLEGGVLDDIADMISCVQGGRKTLEGISKEFGKKMFDAYVAPVVNGNGDSCQ